MNEMTIEQLQAYIFRCIRDIEILMNTKAEAIKILEQKEKEQNDKNN